VKYDMIKKVQRGFYELVDRVIESCIAKNYGNVKASAL